MFLVLQLWCAPYRTPSNNFLAMAVNMSIVLNFISSIGVHPSTSFDADISELMLTVALFIAAFTVFGITLCSLLTAVRNQTTALREPLLDSTSEPSRPGVFPINSDDTVPAVPSSSSASDTLEGGRSDE